jgi:hypothetical protein
MRLTKFNEETGKYELIKKAKTQEEFMAQRKAVIQRLGEFEENAERRVQNAEWISVKDRLPQPSEKCVVALKVGNETQIDLGERVPCYNLRTKERYYEWEITYDWDEGQGCEITHWMPLPQPPKMKGADDEQR